VLTGLIGKKLGMTQVGDASGRVQAVTVIQLGPCAVTQLKSAPTDGYEAVQLGHDATAYRLLFVCVIIAFVAVFVAEWLLRKRNTR